MQRTPHHPHLATIPPTNSDVLRRAISCFEPDARCLHIVRRKGHPHLALPISGDAARRTLALYQPQRPAGKILSGALRTLAKVDVHGLLTRKMDLPDCAPEALEPPLPTIIAGTSGIMLGSPEHRIRRAIASYQTTRGWEVAKLAIGNDGEEMLAREAATLIEFASLTSAAPSCLGLHRGKGITVLRMPRIEGTPLAAGSSDQALELLDAWISDQPDRTAADFPEWGDITRALIDRPSGPQALKRLASMRLTPVLRHGDFARWNLLTQLDGKLVALDWEWAGTDGMPGLDLAHYFLQDHRLVQRFAPVEAISATLAELRRPAAEAYLRKTGWSENPLLPVIASLAWKQGAGHQENRIILDAAVAALSQGDPVIR